MDKYKKCKFLIHFAQNYVVFKVIIYLILKITPHFSYFVDNKSNNMKTILLLAFSALLLGGTSIPKKSVVTSDSTLSFMVVNMGFREVKGTFSGMKGDIQFDKKNLDSCNFNVCVETSTVNTGNEKRDAKFTGE